MLQGRCSTLLETASVRANERAVVLALIAQAQIILRLLLLAPCHRSSHCWLRRPLLCRRMLHGCCGALLEMVCARVNTRAAMVTRFAQTRTRLQLPLLELCRRSSQF